MTGYRSVIGGDPTVQNTSSGTEAVTQVTSDDSHETVRPGNDKIMEIMKSMLSEYPTLVEFNTKHISLPSVILAPSTLNSIQKEYNVNGQFFIELTTFTNTVTILDVMYNGGSGDGIFKDIVKGLKRVYSPTTLRDNRTDIMRRRSVNTSVLSSHENITVDVILRLMDEYIYIIALYLFSTLLHLVKYDPMEGLNER